MLSISVAVVVAVLAWGLARAKPALSPGPLKASAQGLAPAIVAVSPAAPVPAKKPEPSNVKLFAPLGSMSKRPGNTAGIVGNPRELVQLKPGVYKTEPFACIVVVPGSQLDDAILIQPPAGDFPMRTVTPDLRFVPISPAGR